MNSMVHRIPTGMGVPFIQIHKCIQIKFYFSLRSSAKKSPFPLYVYFVFNSSFVNEPICSEQGYTPKSMVESQWSNEINTFKTV